MVLLELATYFFGAVVSLVVAIFLFGVKIKSKGEGSFYRVKLLLATCASIDVIQYTGNLLCIWNGFDYLLLDKFVVPVAFYVQIYLVSFAFLAILHSRLNVLKYRILLPVPVLLISVVYVIAFWKFNGWTSSMENYISFTETIPARLISALLYAIIILEVIIMLVAACVRIIKYREIIGNYFSGQQKISSSKPILLIFAVVTYICLASFDFIASKPAVDMALMWVNTILYMSFAILVLNLQVTYIEASPEISIVSTAMTYFDESGTWGQNHPVEFPQNEDFIAGTPFCHAPCMVRRDAYQAVNGYTDDPLSQKSAPWSNA